MLIEDYLKQAEAKQSERTALVLRVLNNWLGNEASQSANLAFLNFCVPAKPAMTAAPCLDPINDYGWCAKSGLNVKGMIIGLLRVLHTAPVYVSGYDLKDVKRGPRFVQNLTWSVDRLGNTYEWLERALPSCGKEHPVAFWLNHLVALDCYAVEAVLISRLQADDFVVNRLFDLFNGLLFALERMSMEAVCDVNPAFQGSIQIGDHLRYDGVRRRLTHFKVVPADAKTVQAVDELLSNPTDVRKIITGVQPMTE